MTRKIISLNDSNWHVGSVAQKPFSDVNDLSDVAEWLPALVPGDVRLDLLRAEKISDPFYADNNESSQWIDAHDWWYIRDIDLELERDERAFFVFDGIDYQSAVFVNSKQLGRHSGMFSRQVYELPTGDRRPKTENTTSVIGHPSSVAIRIWGSDALPKLKLTRAQELWSRIVRPLFHPPDSPFPDRYATLKCQMQFGWDFAPRLRTSGIWDDAHIVVTKSVFIRDAFIKSKVKHSKSKRASIVVSLTLDSDCAQDVRIECNVGGKNFQSATQTFMFDVQLAPGVHVHLVDFDLRDAQLWNPWDRGAPNLYEIEIRILSEASAQSNASRAPLDSLSETFGIRSFELARTSTGKEPWQFIVNGQREFLRGANWVPLETIPARLARDDYAARLQQARDANIIFLRVWGGGLREKRAFYDLCDELGILVWQEFPFAGAVLDRFPRDDVHLQLVRNECGEIVRALRNHPSLVVWCGGNELSVTGNCAIVETLREVVATQDNTRPFKPASPYRDESHNWRVWHRLANLRDYRKDASPFLSEFGLQSLPNLESLNKFLPDDAPPRMLEYHRAQLKKLERYARAVWRMPSGETASHATRHTHQVTMTQEFIYATQRAQAIGLQIAIEHMRRRKGATTGVAIWQLNDAAPAISWSVIDYYGVPKRAYYELAKLYSPVLASFDYELIPRRAGDVVRGNLWLINDLCRAFEDVELCAELNGREIYSRRVNIASDSSEKLDAVTVTLSGGENILRLVAREHNLILSDHEYDLNFCDVGEISLTNWLMAWAGRQLMR